VSTRIERGDLPPPGMPVVATGPDSAALVDWHIGRGAEQLLCVPIGAPVPKRVVIFVPDEAARDGTLAVAASLLRHVPAEALYLAIFPQDTPESARADCLRALLDARTAALSRHGLDMRTESRFGYVRAELLRELTQQEDTMLVLGVAQLRRLARPWLPELLEGSNPRHLLVVRPTQADTALEA
jgi:hypothetical protein